MMIISHETLQGIKVNGKVWFCFNLYSFRAIFTVSSFVELLPFIFKIPGVTSFLTEKLCQDPLEKFFGNQRQRGGTSDNPSVKEFCKNTQALRVINGTCSNIQRGNCRGSKTFFDIEKESAPLPKRGRK